MRGTIGMKRILITRSVEDNARWAEDLRAADLQPVELPCIRCEPIPESAALLALELARCDWLALTSRRGARAVAALAPGGLPDGISVAAVGAASADAARAVLGHCDLVSPEQTGHSLAIALAECASERVLLAGAQDGLPDLRDGLTTRGVECVLVPVYRTHPAVPSGTRAPVEADAVFLASPSAVEGLMAQTDLPATVAIVTLGPATSAAAQAAGLTVAAEAAGRDLPAMIHAWRSLDAAHQPPDRRS
jgi:uroporphyrinogen-III synthase